TSGATRRAASTWRCCWRRRACRHGRPRRRPEATEDPEDLCGLRALRSLRVLRVLRAPCALCVPTMKLSITDLDLAGKKVFIRVDFNVPIKDGVIGDDTRIRASLPTIQYALDRGATVLLASHLGRPKGKPAPEYSLQPVAGRLAELLGRPVVFAPDCVGPEAAKAVAEAHAGGKVVLLENVRFHA